MTVLPSATGGQSEVKQSRQIFEAGQAVKVGIGGSLGTVKGSPGNRWAQLMLESQGSRPDFWCDQGVKHKNLDVDHGRRGSTGDYIVPIPPLKLLNSVVEYW